MTLKVIEVLQDDKRISSIDLFRGIAICSVVIFHFGYFSYGYLGVDLFFVISGLLIGGLLLKEFETNDRINFFKFFLSRGFKIWPSYYFFLIVGNLICPLLYSNTHSDQIIRLWDIKRYVFFYQNYTGPPFHYSFDIVWSLCVEEHFYILLPLMFLFVQSVFRKTNQRTWLLIFIIIVIIMGTVFKFLSLYFTQSKDTFSGTHNRIDALGWGVLLSFILKYYNAVIKGLKNTYAYSIIGCVCIVILVVLNITSQNPIYTKILFHALIPIALVMVIFGVYYYDFSKYKPIRIIAYYSYNWYLWHCIFCYFIYDSIGKNFSGLIVYLVITFIIAVLFTTVIEEKALAVRPVVLRRFFN
ncbi:MAG: acyltransferase [Mucilaginibacter sp.]